MNTRRTPHKPANGMLEKGFTLVELLIVVIILAILAAIVVPQFASTTTDAQHSSADSTLAGLRSAIDLYYQQHNNTYPGANPSSSLACVAPGTAGGGAANSATAFIDQLSLYTDIAGGACSISNANFKFGPYLKSSNFPTDPFLGVSALVVVNTGNLKMGADSDPGPGGFKYDSKAGKVIINLAAHEHR